MAPELDPPPSSVVAEVAPQATSAVQRPLADTPKADEDMPPTQKASAKRLADEGFDVVREKQKRVDIMEDIKKKGDTLMELEPLQG